MRTGRRLFCSHLASAELSPSVSPRIFFRSRGRLLEPSFSHKLARVSETSKRLNGSGSVKPSWLGQSSRVYKVLQVNEFGGGCTWAMWSPDRVASFIRVCTRDCMPVCLPLTILPIALRASVMCVRTNYPGCANQPHAARNRSGGFART